MAAECAPLLEEVLSTATPLIVGLALLGILFMLDIRLYAERLRREAKDAVRK